jgi:hypothetical protein
MGKVFRALCFDVLKGPIQLSYAKTTPFWIFAASKVNWEARLRDASHAHYEFIVRTKHPDITIDYGVVSDAWRV